MIIFLMTLIGDDPKVITPHFQSMRGIAFRAC